MVRASIAAVLLLASLAWAEGPDAGVKPRVAVLYFDVNSTSEDLKIFSKGLAELLISDLAATGKVGVLERARIEDVLTELKLGESRFADKSTFAKAGNLLGAHYLVTGSLIGNKPPFRMTAKVYEVLSSYVVGQANVQLEGDDVFGAEEKVVATLVEQLVKKGAIEAPPEAPKKAHKLPLSTAVKYARALDAKDKKKPEDAKKLLGEVVKEQPQFALAQLDLLSLSK